MSHEITSSIRRRPSSPAAEPPPLENDDLLDKILLRLPPLPSSLPRASAVCKRWRGLVSDPRFVRRFRAHHRRNPPLLGCFIGDYHNFRFQPILEAPNRLPQGRFSFPVDFGDSFLPLGCRHGLMLVLHESLKQLLVWDPITGDQHRLDNPPGFNTKTPFSAAVLRTAGEAHHFQVVLVGNTGMQHTQAVASVYSSETGVWGNLITSQDFSCYVPYGVYVGIPSVMVGDSLYWLIAGNSFGMLEFDLERQSLGLIPMPGKEALAGGTGYGDILVLTEGGGLGFLFVSGFSAQLWKRETNCDGGASWVLGRTIALDKLLSMKSENKREDSFILGFAEENNVVLLRTSIGIFSIQLESLQFKKLSQSNFWYSYYPFEGVYTADMGNGRGHDGAEILHNI